MSRSKLREGEPMAQDLSDIEDGEIKPNCSNCGKKQNRHVKYVMTENVYGDRGLVKTKNFIGVCTNKQCYHYSDPKNIPSWVDQNKVLTA